MAGLIRFLRVFRKPIVAKAVISDVIMGAVFIGNSGTGVGQLTVTKASPKLPALSYATSKTMYVPGCSYAW